MLKFAPLLLSLAALPLLPSCTSCDSTTSESLAASTISHDVFFTLKPDAVQNADALIGGCLALRSIPGVVHLVAGHRDPAQARDVNEQNYHVGLHVEFIDQAAYDGYGPHATHQALLSEFGNMFASVVVYDSTLTR